MEKLLIMENYIEWADGAGLKTGRIMSISRRDTFASGGDTNQTVSNPNLTHINTAKPNTFAEVTKDLTKTANIALPIVAEEVSQSTAKDITSKARDDVENMRITAEELDAVGLDMEDFGADEPVVKDVANATSKLNKKVSLFSK